MCSRSQATVLDNEREDRERCRRTLRRDASGGRDASGATRESCTHDCEHGDATSCSSSKMPPSIRRKRRTVAENSATTTAQAHLPSLVACRKCQSYTIQMSRQTAGRALGRARKVFALWLFKMVGGVGCEMFQLPAERTNEIVELRFERWLIRKRSLLAFKWRIAGSVARKIDRIVVDQKKGAHFAKSDLTPRGMKSPKNANTSRIRVVRDRTNAHPMPRCRAVAWVCARPTSDSTRSTAAPARFMWPSGAGKH